MAIGLLHSTDSEKSVHRQTDHAPVYYHGQTDDDGAGCRHRAVWTVCTQCITGRASVHNKQQLLQHYCIALFRVQFHGDGSQLSAVPITRLVSTHDASLHSSCSRVHDLSVSVGQSTVGRIPFHTSRTSMQALRLLTTAPIHNKTSWPRDKKPAVQQSRVFCFSLFWSIIRASMHIKLTNASRSTNRCWCYSTNGATKHRCKNASFTF